MGKINVYDKIVMQNKKKEKTWKSKNLYINVHLKEYFRMEFTAG